MLGMAVEMNENIRQKLRKGHCAQARAIRARFGYPKVKAEFDAQYAKAVALRGAVTVRPGPGQNVRATETSRTKESTEPNSPGKGPLAMDKGK